MTSPYWWPDPDKQPGDHITASNPRRALVRVVNPADAKPSSPSRRLLLWVILPAVVTAVVVAVLIAHSAGLL